VAQIECPSCGGYRVADRKRRAVLRADNTPASIWKPNLEGTGPQWLLFAMFPVLWFVGYLVDTQLLTSWDSIPLRCGSTVVFLAACILLVRIDFSLERRRAKRLGLHKGIVLREPGP
jgi:hypothetical protein